MKHHAQTNNYKKLQEVILVMKCLLCLCIGIRPHMWRDGSRFSGSPSWFFFFLGLFIHCFMRSTHPILFKCFLLIITEPLRLLVEHC